jgi:hypothetical protein
MTAVWGPLGWMTLHSISTSYPEAPTIAEKQLVSSWLDMFRDTITCPHCRDHFGEILATSRRIFPNFLNSRQDFAVFAFRVHNAVNRRLKKPVYESVAACMERLRENVKLRTAKEYRTAYLNHVTRFWKSLQDISGMIAMKKVNEMRRIEGEYFGVKDTNFNVQIAEDIVVVPRGVLEKDAPDSVPRVTGPRVPVRPQATPAVPDRVPSRMPLGVGFKMTAGGLRLR